MRESAWYPAQHAREDQRWAESKGRLEINGHQAGASRYIYDDDDDDDDDEAKQDTESRRKGKKAKKTGNDYPPACFTLSQEEIEQFFTFLVGVKLPYGYAGR